MEPIVSVVIPCFNHGIYLEETIDSILRSDYESYEIIVIDDFSTDDLTRKVLNILDKPQTRVIQNRIKGVANARNYGIEEAKGRYILPLDADDKISRSYIRKAVEILESSPNVGIVYAKARLFGRKVGEWKLPSYSIERILASNVIFCSAFFRKEDWDIVGGYKPNIPFGKEDWEFWISLIEIGRDVFRLNEFHFFYRIHTISRDTLASEGDKRKITNSYIYSLHKDFFDSNLPNPLQLYQENTYLKIVLNKFHYRILRKLFSPLVNFVRRTFRIPT